MITVAIIENDAITIIKFRNPDGWNKTNKIGPSAESRPRLIPSTILELNRTLNITGLFLKVLKLNFLDEYRVLLFASNGEMPKVTRTELTDWFFPLPKASEMILAFEF
jgi:hypothetical protein